MEKRLVENFFTSLLKKKILVIGDVMIDAYIWGIADRISPEAPVPVVSVVRRENRLGGAANVALNICSLGATPILCGIIGNDEAGNTFRQLLKETQISEEGIFLLNNRPTTIKTRIIANKQQLLRVDEEISTPIEGVSENKFLQHIHELFHKHQFDAIIFQDYDKGALTPTLIKDIIDLSQKKNIPVLVDPKKRNFHHYQKVTLFKPNFKEFSEGVKLDINKNDLKGIYDASLNFLREKSIRYLLLTLSEKGVILVSDEEYHHIPAHLRDIADVSGAGDTVISVAALCMSVGMSPYQVAAIANLAGGLVCEKVGVVPITRNMLENELKKISDFNVQN